MPVGYNLKIPQTGNTFFGQRALLSHPTSYTVVAGDTIGKRFYVSRASADVWEGDAVLTSIDHGVTTEDFAMLSVDFEGQGALIRTTVV